VRLVWQMGLCWVVWWWISAATAAGAPRRGRGAMRAGTEPGLGVAPHADVLGEPVAVYS